MPVKVDNTKTRITFKVLSAGNKMATCYLRQLAKIQPLCCSAMGIFPTPYTGIGIDHLPSNYLAAGKGIFILAVVLGIGGCTTGYAPVSEISTKNTVSKNTVSTAMRLIETAPETYKVKSGDTLYSIAWRYGLDFRQLAQNNTINKENLIYKGQVLQVKSTSKKVLPKVNKSTPVSVSSNTKKTINSQKNKALSKKTTTIKSTTANSKNNTKRVVATAVAGNVRWSWPAKGRVISSFNRENKGLDISGNTGEAVFAAASGKVVYAGNGILGYGNLIIIKHSPQYLSAYAHNSVILVSENQTIKGGKKIAEIGSSGTIKTILHFEIRRDGQPVNPLRYLPKK